MPDILEALMIVCFGLSWPISIRKSWISRTAKGKSLLFEVFIWIGYVFGIWRKFLLVAEGHGGFLFYLAWVFYFLNLTMVSIDMILWLRNRAIDAANDRRAAKEAAERAKQEALEAEAMAEIEAERSEQE